MLIQGALPSLCYAKAMSIKLDSRNIRVFDYATEFAHTRRTCRGGCGDRGRVHQEAKGVSEGRSHPGSTRPSLSAKASAISVLFGEFFHIGGMDAYGMAHAILRGEAGSGGHFPANWRGLANHNARIIAFGDATARNRRMAGPNEWQIVNEVYRNGTEYEEGHTRYSVNLPDGGNPLVVFGVRSVNAKLCSAAGIRSLFIDPRCTELIADLLVCVWDKTGTDIQKYGERGGSKLWQRTHLSDGLRYMIHQLFPMGIEARASVREDLDIVSNRFGSQRPRWGPPRMW